MSDQIQEEIDPELTEFSFEDSERVTTIWIDGYADNPEWDEPEWADHPGDDMPPFQIAMHRDDGRMFVRLSDNGRHCADHSIEQELTDARLNELQEYFTRISGYWPPR